MSLTFLEYTKHYSEPSFVTGYETDKIYAIDIINRAMNLKLDNPRITKKEISKKLKISKEKLNNFALEVENRTLAPRRMRTINATCDECDFKTVSTQALVLHKKIHNKSKDCINKIKSIHKPISENKKIGENKEKFSLKKYREEKCKEEKCKDEKGGTSGYNQESKPISSALTEISERLKVTITDEELDRELGKSPSIY